MEAAGVLMLWVAGGLLFYLALGYLLHRALFPESAIKLSSYFKAEGPPPALQRAPFFLLASAARARGYRSFYEQYRV